MKSKIEIDGMRCAAEAQMDKGSKYPGMSYEEGVAAALAWVLGEDDDPLELEDARIKNNSAN